jgi:hypothetical protein
MFTIVRAGLVWLRGHFAHSKFSQLKILLTRPIPNS